MPDPPTPPPPETPTETPPTETPKPPISPTPKTEPVDETKEVLITIRDEYKAHVTPEQWDAVKNLSIAKQIQILKVMQPKGDSPTKDVKPDINTPLNSPPDQEKRVKTFFEKQRDANFAKNLQARSGHLNRINKIYEGK